MTGLAAEDPGIGAIRYRVRIVSHDRGINPELAAHVRIVRLHAGVALHCLIGMVKRRLVPRDDVITQIGRTFD